VHQTVPNLGKPGAVIGSREVVDKLLLFKMMVIQRWLVRK